MITATDGHNSYGWLCIIFMKICLLTECGHAPNVTLNCTDGSAKVDWVAGCQSIYDCRGLWSCTNMIDYHQEMVTS